jgi:hypothetical protein
MSAQSMPRGNRLNARVKTDFGFSAKQLKGFRMPGNYEVEFDGTGLTLGIYLCRPKSNNLAQRRKLLLTK